MITARKLPALIAFGNFMISQRALLDSEEWSARFGRAFFRIEDQILPAFPSETVEEARRLAEKDGEGLIYLPAEIK